MLLHFDDANDFRNGRLVITDLIVDKTQIDAVVVDILNSDNVLNINFAFNNDPYLKRIFYKPIDKLVEVVHYLDDTLSEYYKLGNFITSNRRNYINMNKISTVNVIKSINKQFSSAEIHFSGGGFVEVFDITEFNEFKRKYELDHL